MDNRAEARLTVWERLVFACVDVYLALRHPRAYARYFRRAWWDGRWASLAYPQSADDKFFWRKAFDHDPRFIQLSDKLAARRWVAEQGFEIPGPDVLWVGTRPEDIPRDLLTDDVLIKSNHAWNQLLYVRDGLPEPEELNRTLRDWLDHDHSTLRQQWAYRDVPPKLFLERVVGGPGEPVEDWKFCTFGRRVERINRANRGKGVVEGQLYLPDETGALQLMPEPPSFCDRRMDGPLPSTFAQMLAWSRAIGAHFDHMRVDFLASGDRVWLGELTVYTQGGLMPGGRDPEAQISRAWDLRRSWFMTQDDPGGWRGLYIRTLRRVLDRSGWPDRLPPG